MFSETYTLTSKDQEHLKDHKDPSIQYALMQGYLTVEDAQHLTEDQIRFLDLPVAQRMHSSKLIETILLARLPSRLRQR